jgi:hypothetical protein
VVAHVSAIGQAGRFDGDYTVDVSLHVVDKDIGLQGQPLYVLDCVAQPSSWQGGWRVRLGGVEAVAKPLDRLSAQVREDNAVVGSVHRGFEWEPGLPDPGDGGQVHLVVSGYPSVLPADPNDVLSISEKDGLGE